MTFYQKMKNESILFIYFN